jgi:hypothetical protein
MPRRLKELPTVAAEQVAVAVVLAAAAKVAVELVVAACFNQHS